jgi:hypothetical protein
MCAALELHEVLACYCYVLCTAGRTSLVNGAGSSSSSVGSSNSRGRSGSSLGSLKAEKAAFLALHGKQYGYNGWLDRNWQREVGDRLGSTLRHYLDFTGVLQHPCWRSAAAKTPSLVCASACICSIMLVDVEQHSPAPCSSGFHIMLLQQAIPGMSK